jgi:hypothetical protein
MMIRINLGGAVLRNIPGTSEATHECCVIQVVDKYLPLAKIA